MSLLKQILKPFVEFEEEKKKEWVPEARTSAAPTVAPTNQPAPGYIAPVEENVDHPLVTGNNFPPSTQTPTASPRSTLTKALPEHEQYFEKLIDDANTKNPIFQGTDFKEFIDSKTDIDNITDEETKYKTAFNVLKRTGLTKEKLISTAQEYHNIIGRDLKCLSKRTFTTVPKRGEAKRAAHSKKGRGTTGFI